MEQKIPVIFDCDPGIDDAVALLMAMAAPRLKVLGITTVVGNTTLEKIQRNARYLCELAGRTDVRVFAGCPRPLMSWTNYDPHQTSAAFAYVEGLHGETGLGNLSFPEPQNVLENQHAVNFLIETLRGASEKITLLATGPLTNVALALVMAPDIRGRIERILLMGGVAGIGNITPAAEHNFFVDPHAAAIVFDSGVPLVMSGLDLTRQVVVTTDFMQRLRAQKTRVSEALANIIESRPVGHYEPGMTSAVLHDPTVVGYLLAPELFTGRSAYVTLETYGGPCLGRSTVHFALQESFNAFVLETVDAEAFYGLMLDLLGCYS